MDSGHMIIYLGLLVLVLALYVFIVRWVFRVNDIIFYLDKINEKLAKMEEDKNVK